MLKKLFGSWQGKTHIQKKGFTLLELLIVIAIIAALSVILVIVLNPAETLKKSRDTQRMSDLSSLKTALGIYTTSKIPVSLSGPSDNTECQALTSWVGEEATGGLFYSLDIATEDITDTILDGTTFTSNGGLGPFQPATAAAAVAVSGTGWLPVKLDDITGGSPISNMPIDPTNDVSVTTGSATSTAAAVNNGALVYRYACNSTASTYEIDAVLESTAYTSDDNKMTKDGGNNTSYYEVGTNLSILGTGTDF